MFGEIKLKKKDEISSLFAVMKTLTNRAYLDVLKSYLYQILVALIYKIWW